MVYSCKLERFWSELEGNPYSIRNNRIIFDRDNLGYEYSFAIPNSKSLNIISEFAPIIEVGSGTGYWAYLLKRLGVDILATDTDPPSPEECFTTITRMNDWELLNHPHRTLMMCWVPEKQIDLITQYYPGNKIIWIGEPIKIADFIIKERIDIPTWNGYNDSLFIFTRK